MTGSSGNNSGPPTSSIISGGQELTRGSSWWDHFSNNAAASSVLGWTGPCLKGFLALAISLYVLNQKHLLPKPLAALVSKALFWPTVPLMVKRLGSWSTVVDDTVMIGAAPFGFAKYPERLYKEYNVRGVINLCQEYQGPDKQYEELGMTHLRLPTVDHFEPTVADMEKAVAFIKKHHDQGERVYVHCRGGHGRSAAIVFAWLIYNDPNADLQEMNREFCVLRSVRKTLWRQTNIIKFQRKLQLGGDTRAASLLKGHYDIDESPDRKEL